MIKPERDYLSQIKWTQRGIQKRYPEFYNYLSEKYSDSTNFTEQMYRYFYNIDQRPTCKVCGKPVRFIDRYTGFRQFCCHDCASKDPDYIEKVKSTCMKHFGTTHQLRCQAIIQKSKQTKIDKYGSIEAAYEIIAKKTKQTIKEKYGSIEAAYEIFKEKRCDTLINKHGSLEAAYKYRNEISKQTNIERYGTPYPIQNKDIAEKHKRSIRQKIIKDKGIIDINQNGEWICKCPHPECNKCIEKTFTIDSHHFIDRTRDKTEICTKLLPYQKSNSKGTTIELIIQRFLDRYNINYIRNSKNIIKGKELDIYIPEKKIAIECNGIYWHSKYEKDYHIKKFIKCREQGIQLINIWEDQIFTKYDVVKSLLENKLGLTKTKIFARKCIIQPVKSKIANTFIEQNHIQGRSNSTIHLGLFYNGELVSVMSFKKPNRYSGAKNVEDNIWELSRYCCKLYTSVIGGASKLLKYFINNYKPNKIISFSSNDISNGNLYSKLGFYSENNITPAYWYINGFTKQRFHRSSFSKKSLIKQGYDKTMTEEEIVGSIRNIFKIYDSGHVKWILNITR